ncbi:MAG: hypothetical protein Q8P59_03415, partial [Dehalococcoidia bacterium]|nr:hypothetical protein [Dehalococcoidia bacterium]
MLQTLEWSTTGQYKSSRPAGASKVLQPRQTQMAVYGTGSIDRGMPVYAECGGLMYLGESLRDFQGQRHRMAGAIPVSSRIDSPRLSLGYRTVRALNDGPLLGCGETVRGHEFLWSVLENDTTDADAYCVLDKTDRKEGFQKKGMLASNVHHHLG